MDGQWDILISSLQDIYNANEVILFDDDRTAKRLVFEDLPDAELQSHQEKFQAHMDNVNRALRLLATVRDNLGAVMDYEATKLRGQNTASSGGNGSGSGSGSGNSNKANSSKPSPVGKQYWMSQYNPKVPITIGCEVAYKPKRGGDGEWFQCEVIKISADGMRFEVRDPEPDELGDTGKVFKCRWQDIIAIPSDAQSNKLSSYPAGTKVLARYPETTTFYPAVVIGHRRDGVCRLQFDGEEEANKETEVPRRLVLPYPTVSATAVRR